MSQKPIQITIYDETSRLVWPYFLYSSHAAFYWNGIWVSKPLSMQQCITLGVRQMQKLTLCRDISFTATRHNRDSRCIKKHCCFFFHYIAFLHIWNGKTHPLITFSQWLVLWWFILEILWHNIDHKPYCDTSAFLGEGSITPGTEPFLFLLGFRQQTFC